MGLVNAEAKILLKECHKELEVDKCNCNGAKAIVIGTVDYYVDYKLLKKYGFTNKEEHEIHKKLPVNTNEWYNSNKKLCSNFFKHFGYDDYKEIDINERADIKIDLNYPIPENLKGQFDIVWDHGSVEHIMNICQAMNNLVDLVKVGGIILHSQGTGDQTNAGYWTISPNYYLDFYKTNGFEIKKIILRDRRGDYVKYSEVKTKNSTIGSLIPFYLLPSFHLRLIRDDIVSGIFIKFPFLNYVYNGLNRRVPKIAGVINFILGRSATGGADWCIMVIAKKIKEISNKNYEIQNIYRSSKAI